MQYSCTVQLYITTVQYNCVVQLYSTTVLYNCTVQLYSTTVQYNCTVQLCSTAVQYNCVVQLCNLSVQHNCAAQLLCAAKLLLSQAAYTTFVIVNILPHIVCLPIPLIPDVDKHTDIVISKNYIIDTFSVGHFLLPAQYLRRTVSWFLE